LSIALLPQVLLSSVVAIEVGGGDGRGEGEMHSGESREEQSQNCPLANNHRTFPAVQSVAHLPKTQ